MRGTSRYQKVIFSQYLHLLTSQWFIKEVIDGKIYDKKPGGHTERRRGLPREKGNQQIDAEHLLWALLDDEEGVASQMLKRIGINTNSTANRTLKRLSTDCRK